MCCANWLKFIPQYTGELSYDYNKIKRMSDAEVNRRVLACLSCDAYDSDDESEQGEDDTE